MPMLHALSGVRPDGTPGRHSLMLRMGSHNADFGPDAGDVFDIPQLLPEELPEHPFELFRGWWEEAHRKKVQPNPHTFALATIDPDGRPAARMVLCKGMDLHPDRGFIVFYTNRQSRKGLALEANPRVAGVFHWDDLERQVRFEGLAVHSPDHESDAYFASRPIESRIGAWASDQSRPIASRAELMLKVFETVQRLGVAVDDEAGRVPRPPHWGGFRIWIDAMELWVNGAGRVHDRARWERTLKPAPPGGGGGFEGGAWRATRLQP